MDDNTNVCFLQLFDYSQNDSYHSCDLLRRLLVSHMLTTGEQNVLFNES
jgi:hypothetical protein